MTVELHGYRYSVYSWIARLALEEKGISFDELVSAANQPDADPFDLLCHVAFNAPLRTRRERAEMLRREKKDFFDQYSLEARAILEELLEKLRQPITPRRGLDFSKQQAADPVFRSSFTQDDYERAVDTIKEYILANPEIAHELAATAGRTFAGHAVFSADGAQASDEGSDGNPYHR
jgi:hypothetical protein